MRGFVILKIFIEYLIKVKFWNKTVTLQEKAVYLRQSIEQLGSVFVKFGQLLSIRPDLISQVYCDEFFSLLDNVPQFDRKEIDTIFFEQFQKNPLDIFTEFSYTPFASASFGQAHQALTESNEKVVIKIQRPGIMEKVKEDFVLLKIIARAFDFVNRNSNKLFDLAKEFESWTFTELDYIQEARNLEKYNKLANSENNLSIGAPKYYKEYSSKKIITMEFVEGWTLSNIIRAYKADDKRMIFEFEKAGFNKKAVIKKIIANLIETAHLNGYFHADPHPANIIFTKHGNIVLIDFGIVGELSIKQRTQLLRYERLSFQGESGAFEALLSLCDVPEGINLKILKRKHDSIMSEIAKLNSTNNYLEMHKLSSPLLEESLKILTRSGIVIPVEVVRYFKAFETIEGLAFNLYPEMNVDELINNFKRVSIVNIVRHLGSYVGEEGIDKLFSRALNLIEGELIK